MAGTRCSYPALLSSSPCSIKRTICYEWFSAAVNEVAWLLPPPGAGYDPSQLFTTDRGSTPVHVVQWGFLGETWPYFRWGCPGLPTLLAVYRDFRGALHHLCTEHIPRRPASVMPPFTPFLSQAQLCEPGSAAAGAGGGGGGGVCAHGLAVRDA